MSFLALHTAHLFSLKGVSLLLEPYCETSVVLQPQASHFSVPLKVSVSNSWPREAAVLRRYEGTDDVDVDGVAGLMGDDVFGELDGLAPSLGGVPGELFIPRIFASREPCRDFSLLLEGDLLGIAFDGEGFDNISDDAGR